MSKQIKGKAASFCTQTHLLTKLTTRLN